MLDLGQNSLTLGQRQNEINACYWPQAVYYQGHEQAAPPNASSNPWHAL
jgi:hypothetical protein